VLSKQFDLIVCSEVIEHLHDREQAVRNMATMLERGGHLLVTCPTGRVYNTERYFGHVSHPSMDELVRLGRENDLCAVLSLNWGWPTYKLLKFLSNVDYKWAIKEFAGGRYSRPKRAVCHFLYLLTFLNMPNSTRGCQMFVLFRKAEYHAVRT
jgi:SAM-dependent methyltransferase